MQSQSNQFINWSYTITGKPELFAVRGYTGHEYLPWFNLYNMNGRLYDPLVGRFLSPDPYIADLTSTQEYNRYSYCLNNPLIYSDPSGYKKVPKQEDFNWQYIAYLNERFGGGGGRTSYYNHINSMAIPSSNVNSDMAAIESTDYNEITSAIKNGFTITVIDAFNRPNVAISIGQLNTQTSGNGGLYSFSSFASTFYISTTGYIGTVGNVATNGGGTWDPVTNE